MDGSAPLIEPPDILHQATVVAEAFLELFLFAVIGELDGHARQKKSDDLQAPGQGVEVKVGSVQKAGAGLEGYHRAGAQLLVGVGFYGLRFPHLPHLAHHLPGSRIENLDRGDGQPIFVALVVDHTIPLHPHLQPLGQRVGGLDADAVQSAAGRIAAFFELAPGVQLGKDQLQRRPLFFGVHPGGNATPVVGHG